MYRNKTVFEKTGMIVPRDNQIWFVANPQMDSMTKQDYVDGGYIVKDIEVGTDEPVTWKLENDESYTIVDLSQ